MRITKVRASRWAEHRGIRAGDLLVGLGSWEITSDENLAFVLQKTQEENPRSVKAYLVRDGETLYVELPIDGE